MLDTNYSARTTYTAKLLPKMLWYFRCHQFRWYYLIYNYQNEKAQSEYGYQSYWRPREIKHYCTHTHKVDVDMLSGNTFLFIEPVFFCCCLFFVVVVLCPLLWPWASISSLKIKLLIITWLHFPLWSESTIGSLSGFTHKKFW